MQFLRKSAIFAAGGLGYVGLELLWRGRSHSSMFLAGGTCFLLLGRLGGNKMTLPQKAIAGAGIITLVEYTTGLLVNRNYTVWDYRALPMNLHGQICLPFTLLWIPISFGGMLLYRQLDRLLPGSDK